jgi:hypothetical protein
VKLDDFCTTHSKKLIAKATIALTAVSKNGFQECFQKLYGRWKKCTTAQGNHFVGNVVQIDVWLLISL